MFSVKLRFPSLYIARDFDLTKAEKMLRNVSRVYGVIIDFDIVII